MKFTMNKKIIFLALVLLIFPMVNAWEYDESYREGGASAYARVEGGLPICDGELRGYICKGSWYVDINHDGDQFKMGRGINSWNEVEDGDKNGLKSSKLFDVQDGKYYLEKTDEAYVLCAWDYDSSDDGWAWASICGGYFGNFNLPRETVENCFPDEKRCEGKIYYECTNDKWVNDIIIGKCDVECIDKSDCDFDSRKDNFCSEDKLSVLSDYSEGKCEENKCSQSKEVKTIEECKYGCHGGVCLPETFTYVSPLVYVIPIIMISSVALIIWQLRKKPKRKK